MLSRCLENIDRTEWPRPSVASRQPASHERPGLSSVRGRIHGSANPTDPDWVYSYDAWTVPLADNQSLAITPPSAAVG